MMHELSLVTDLVRRIESVAREQAATRVTAIRVKIGALAHISPEHLRKHLLEASRGTVADDARLDFEVLSDAADPHAQDVILDNLELEVEG